MRYGIIIVCVWFMVALVN